MKSNDKKRFSMMTTQELEERKVEIIKHLPSIGHMIHGSLIPSVVRCGKPTCHCTKGEGHKTIRLSSYYHGKTSVDHVPASWEPWMCEGIENYKSAQEMIAELSEIYLALFKRRNKAD